MPLDPWPLFFLISDKTLLLMEGSLRTTALYVNYSLSLKDTAAIPEDLPQGYTTHSDAVVLDTALQISGDDNGLPGPGESPDKSPDAGQMTFTAGKNRLVVDVYW